MSMDYNHPCLAWETLRTAPRTTTKHPPTPSSVSADINRKIKVAEGHIKSGEVGLLYILCVSDPVDIGKAEDFGTPAGV